METNNTFAFTKEVINQSELIINNYEYHTGTRLVNGSSPEERAEALFTAPFVVLSHGTGQDPCFNYANQKAVALWEMPWDELVGMPSRKSAEPAAEKDRKKFLKEVEEKGFISNYEGIRISKNGHRFIIKNVFLMNLYNNNNQYVGQAAVFSQWEYL